MRPQDVRICVVGLGYVGFPLIHKFYEAGFRDLFGVDINPTRIANIRNGLDHTSMVPVQLMDEAAKEIVWLPDYPSNAEVYIVCVPTPDDKGVPDYGFVMKAVSQILAVADNCHIVVESTIGPGTMAGRIRNIVRASGKNVTLHHSPERINPGPHAFFDLGKTGKMLACDEGVHGTVQAVYEAVFENVSTYSDTRVAELAKCFENTQRDMNIALMNELAMQCHTHGVDYQSVVRALRTKGSSPVFNSGMVGGHCIPVDPYYLAEWYRFGRGDSIVLPDASRNINEGYIDYITALAMTLPVEGFRRILILGVAYKPDVNDTRNSGGGKVFDKLVEANQMARMFDPLCGLNDLQSMRFNVVIGATNHKLFHKWILREKLPLTIDCNFINAGGFMPSQLAGIHNIVNL